MFDLQSRPCPRGEDPLIDLGNLPNHDPKRPQEPSVKSKANTRKSLEDSMIVKRRVDRVD
jgi:hypothetical protein